VASDFPLQYHELLAEGEVLQQQTAAITTSAKNSSEPKPQEIKHGSNVIADALFGLAAKLLISESDRIVTRHRCVTDVRRRFR
jgi:hypothetical protein